ncbi:phage tail protein [Budvicia aquatica]|uniref:P2 phage tail completion protein R (GpR) n=1 Tax=Budvicia aquatica TaxID=82979 RepID=A0A2C6DLM1_9GAMM|nr:phage tail protein [Budvicia aquatica]PHI29242.1 phage tail protein [Budvicia aquatica]VFS47455.1 P2 phage tail completion protein R (GpR) [Budvicia aquatica]
MIKPDSLRDMLNKSVDFVRKSPENLHVFIKDGKVISTLGPSLSFEYQYVMNILITDYSGDANLLIVPILYWLRKNQPDILTAESDGIRFEVDFLNHQQQDIDISLRLTERVIASMKDGAIFIQNIPEPPPPINDEWAMP